MIFKKDCMRLILSKFPDFQERWRKHLDWWEGEEAGICNDMTQFSRYVTDLIIYKETDTLPQIFDFIETLMIEGDPDVKDATATCFLENLVNVTPKMISANSFIPLLGKASTDHIRAWDEFTGV
jgi:hypothetical protein